jgi:hypothetical protein
MIRVFGYLVLVFILTPTILTYPGENWHDVTSVWDQGKGFTFTYDPAYVAPFGRGGVVLSAAPSENEMSWHGGGIYQNIQPFGYIEIVAKLPKGAGLWPALFLFNYDDRREIDIFEMIDPACKNLQFTVHDARNAAQVNHEYIGKVDLSKSYHRYGFRWTSKQLTWYLDGVKIWQTDQYIPQEPMYLYLALSAGGWAGLPDANTPRPAHFYIKSVSVSR